MRRILVLAVTAMMVTGGVSLAVAPAALADQTISVSCPSTDEVTLYVQPNEVITLREIGCNDRVLYNPYFFQVAGGNPTVVTIHSDAVDGAYGGVWFSAGDERGTRVTFIVGSPRAVVVNCPSTDEITLYVQPNEVITIPDFRENGCNDRVLYNPYFFRVAGGQSASVFTMIVTIDSNAVDGAYGGVWFYGVDWTPGTRVFFVVDSPVAAADAPPIPAWVQAYGRASADATCEDGWDASWQSWAEPVTGGWVCTRSIPSLG